MVMFSLRDDPSYLEVFLFFWIVSHGLEKAKEVCMAGILLNVKLGSLVGMEHVHD